MRTLLTSALLATLLLPSIGFAQSSTSTATTTSQSSNSSSGAGTALLIGAGVTAGVVAAKALSSGISGPPGISFGGRVLTALPCISPLGPSLAITIKPAGVFPINYIWTPATLTKPTQLSVPTPGGQVLGIADIPYACWNPIKGGLFGLFTFLSYSYGLRMQIVGTSPY
ncbi:MAG TPA: hypothetical protein VHD31_00535 [Candidatus Paceibacterota bacterium]|nr:hypothetical protein [Candidatus Paceibacterota bacterium]